jgi:hypothetical protein
VTPSYRQQLLDAALSEDPTAKLGTLTQRFLDAVTDAEQLLQDLDLGSRCAVPETGGRLVWPGVSDPEVGIRRAAVVVGPDGIAMESRTGTDCGPWLEDGSC